MRLAKVEQVGDAKVADFRDASGVEENIGWLNVAMHDASLVRKLKTT